MEYDLSTVVLSSSKVGSKYLSTLFPEIFCAPFIFAPLFFTPLIFVNPRNFIIRAPLIFAHQIPFAPPLIFVHPKSSRFSIIFQDFAYSKFFYQLICDFFEKTFGQYEYKHPFHKEIYRPFLAVRVASRDGSPLDGSFVQMRFISSYNSALKINKKQGSL